MTTRHNKSLKELMTTANTSDIKSSDNSVYGATDIDRSCSDRSEGDTDSSNFCVDTLTTT